MAELRFTKMHGLGNDFIVFDDPAGRFNWDELSTLARKLCDRRFGIGGDGIIAIGHAPLTGEAWPDGADYEMRYLNADGSRAEMCGNGIRCLAKYAAEELGDARDELMVLTGAGVLPLRLIRDGASVRAVSVGLGVPRFQAEEIPTTLRSAGALVLGVPLELAGTALSLYCVNLGNPHAVSFVPAITDFQVLELGPAIETHSAFPQKTNAEFVQVLGPRRIRMRVWERGCGETWACGTGAGASVVAAVLAGHCAAGADVTVLLNGGELTITWPGDGQPVTMTGPAEAVFTGVVQV